MINRKEVYKCEICGSIVEVLNGGGGELVCCGQPMNFQKENKEEASEKKHIPIIRGNKVIVGFVRHPMSDEHFIEWIEATDKKNNSTIIFLTPKDEPEVEFLFTPVSARAYCNIHRLWKSK